MRVMKTKPTWIVLLVSAVSFWACAALAQEGASPGVSVSTPPSTADAYEIRADDKQTKGDLDGAIADYTKAIELKPDLVEVYYNRGLAKQTKGDLDGAIADYTKAIELGPDLVSPYFNRGRAKQAKGDLSGAIADYTKAIELKPDQTDLATLYTNRSSAKRAIGDIDGANADQANAIHLKDSGASPQNAPGNFSEAEKLNTITAYRAFLRQFDSDLVPPPSSLYWAARGRIESLLLEDIRAHGIGNRPHIASIQPDASSPVGAVTFVGYPPPPQFAPGGRMNGSAVQSTSKGTLVLFLLYPSDGLLRMSDNGTGMSVTKPFGAGSIHRFVGKVDALYSNCTIVGDTKEPLSFLLTANYGYIYLDGHGSVTFSDGSSISFPPPLQPPSDVVVSVGDSKVVLAWTPLPGADSYSIFRGSAAGGEGLVPYRKDVEESLFTDEGLTNGQVYFYEIAAENSAGESVRSSELSAKPLPSVPATPTGLRGRVLRSQIVLTWDATPGATAYKVFRSTLSGKEGAFEYAASRTSSFTDKAALAGRAYFYWIKAVNMAGVSGQSTEASVKIPPTP